MLSVRVSGVLALIATLSGGAAQASSFVVMGDKPPAKTPSIVTLGAVTAAKNMPSVIVMGDPAPEVTEEKVAAIPRKQAYGPNFKPLVIRGGVPGDAFAAPEEKAKSEKSDSEQQSASAKNGTAKNSESTDTPAAPTTPAAPSAPAAPASPPAYLPPNGLGKHRY